MSVGWLLSWGFPEIFNVAMVTMAVSESESEWNPSATSAWLAVTVPTPILNAALNRLLAKDSHP